MKRSLTLFSLITLFFLFLATGCDKPANKDKSAKAPKNSQTAKKATDFTLPYHAKAGEFKLYNAIKEKTVVLLFFSTSCPHCQEELAELKDIISNYKNLRFIAVDGGDSESSITRFFKDIGIDIECIVDNSGEVFKSYNVYGIPTTYIIGKDGNIIDNWIGKKSLEEMKSIFSKL